MTKTQGAKASILALLLLGPGSVGVFLPGDIDDFAAFWQNCCR